VGYDISYDHLVGWEADLRLLTERVAGSLFTRPESRATFTGLVRGLLADVLRKNSWQLAEHVGHGSAHRLEWLLNGEKWHADALRDRVRDFVVATLGAEDGVLIADDTQVIQKGDKSVGVAPQHCGATGQTENCQVLPMLSYASARGARVHRPGVVPAATVDRRPAALRAGRSARRARVRHQPSS
jgi:SRSO17 transposase